MDKSKEYRCHSQTDTLVNHRRYTICGYDVLCDDLGCRVFIQMRVPVSYLPEKLLFSNFSNTAMLVCIGDSESPRLFAMSQHRWPLTALSGWVEASVHACNVIDQYCSAMSWYWSMGHYDPHGSFLRRKPLVSSQGGLALSRGLDQPCGRVLSWGLTQLTRVCRHGPTMEHSRTSTACAVTSCQLLIAHSSY